MSSSSPTSSPKSKRSRPNNMLDTPQYHALRQSLRHMPPVNPPLPNEKRRNRVIPPPLPLHNNNRPPQAAGENAPSSSPPLSSPTASPPRFGYLFRAKSIRGAGRVQQSPSIREESGGSSSSSNGNSGSSSSSRSYSKSGVGSSSSFSSSSHHSDSIPQQPQQQQQQQLSQQYSKEDYHPQAVGYNDNYRLSGDDVFHAEYSINPHPYHTNTSNSNYSTADYRVSRDEVLAAHVTRSRPWANYYSNRPSGEEYRVSRDDVMNAAVSRLGMWSDATTTTTMTPTAMTRPDGTTMSASVDDNNYYNRGTEDYCRPTFDNDYNRDGFQDSTLGGPRAGEDYTASLTRPTLCQDDNLTRPTFDYNYAESSQRTFGRPTFDYDYTQRRGQQPQMLPTLQQHLERKNSIGKNEMDGGPYYPERISDDDYEQQDISMGGGPTAQKKALDDDDISPQNYAKHYSDRDNTNEEEGSWTSQEFDREYENAMMEHAIRESSKEQHQHYRQSSSSLSSELYGKKPKSSMPANKKDAIGPNLLEDILEGMSLQQPQLQQMQQQQHQAHSLLKSEQKEHDAIDPTLIDDIIRNSQQEEFDVSVLREMGLKTVPDWVDDVLDARAPERDKIDPQVLKELLTETTRQSGGEEGTGTTTAYIGEVGEIGGGGISFGSVGGSMGGMKKKKSAMKDGGEGEGFKLEAADNNNISEGSHGPFALDVFPVPDGAFAAPQQAQEDKEALGDGSMVDSIAAHSISPRDHPNTKAVEFKKSETDESLERALARAAERAEVDNLAPAEDEQSGEVETKNNDGDKSPIVERPQLELEYKGSSMSPRSIDQLRQPVLESKKPEPSSGEEKGRLKDEKRRPSAVTYDERGPIPPMNGLLELPFAAPIVEEAQQVEPNAPIKDLDKPRSASIAEAPPRVSKVVEDQRGPVPDDSILLDTCALSLVSDPEKAKKAKPAAALKKSASLGSSGFKMKKDIEASFKKEIETILSGTAHGKGVGSIGSMSHENGGSVGSRSSFKKKNIEADFKKEIEALFQSTGSCPKKEGNVASGGSVPDQDAFIMKDGAENSNVGEDSKKVEQKPTAIRLSLGASNKKDGETESTADTTPHSSIHNSCTDEEQSQSDPSMDLSAPASAVDGGIAQGNASRASQTSYSYSDRKPPPEDPDNDLSGQSTFHSSSQNQSSNSAVAKGRLTAFDYPSDEEPMMRDMQLPPPVSHMSCSSHSHGEEAKIQAFEYDFDDAKPSDGDDNLQMMPPPPSMSADDASCKTDIVGKEEHPPPPSETDLPLPFLRRLSSFSFDEDRYDKDMLPIPHTKPSLGFLSHTPVHPCCDGDANAHSVAMKLRHDVMESMWTQLKADVHEMHCRRRRQAKQRHHLQEPITI